MLSFRDQWHHDERDIMTKNPLKRTGYHDLWVMMTKCISNIFWTCPIFSPFSLSRAINKGLTWYAHRLQCSWSWLCTKVSESSKQQTDKYSEFKTISQMPSANFFFYNCKVFNSRMALITVDRKSLIVRHEKNVCGLLDFGWRPGRSCHQYSATGEIRINLGSIS